MTYPSTRKMRLRGHTGIRVGIILGSVGLVLVIVGIVLLVTQGFGKISDFQRVSFAEGTGTIHFDSAGGYTAYYEAPEASSSVSYGSRIEVALRNSATGAPVAVSQYGANSNGTTSEFTYDYDGRHGVAFLQFHIDTPGTYQVAIRGENVDPNGDVAFGESVATGTVGGIAAIVIGALLLIAGVVLLIVGFASRHGHKKQLQRYGMPPPMYPPPGYAGQPGYPPAGYPGQPGYPGYPPPAGYPPPPQPAQQPPPAEPWPPKE